MNVVLLGAPGAGKGTQSSKICEKLGICHISTGDIFRKHIAEKTPIGIFAKTYIDKGQLVPDEVTVDIVKERISKDDCKNGYLLDGFPRTVAQAEALEDFCIIDRVIDIDVPFELLLHRLTGRRVCPNCGASYHVDFYNDKNCSSCGETLIQRDDDNEETVGLRLNVYKRQTAPLIKYYKKAGVLVTVDGSKDSEDVFSDIVEALK